MSSGHEADTRGLLMVLSFSDPGTIIKRAEKHVSRALHFRSLFCGVIIFPGVVLEGTHAVGWSVGNFAEKMERVNATRGSCRDTNEKLLI